ncbi:MAG: hypothetical protein RLZZ360_846 [Candidatus Parcubacteria bacterium]|jgi:hypothetical protein
MTAIYERRRTGWQFLTALKLDFCTDYEEISPSTSLVPSLYYVVGGFSPGR